MHAGEEIPHGSTYAMPGGMGSDNTAIAIFSELKDPVTIENAGDAPFTISAVTVTAADGVLEEELRVCSTDSTVNECEPYVLSTVGPEEASGLFFQLYPVASGERGASLRIEFTLDGQDYAHEVELRGWGRVGSDEYPAVLYGDGTLSLHQLWGGYQASHDEAPGPMVADAAGNLTFAGTGAALGSANSADLNVFLVRVDASGTLAWAKLYESTAHDQLGQSGDNGLLGNADAMDADAQGNVYLAMRAGNGTNRYLALVAKVAPDGTVLWTRYWHGNTSRLANVDPAGAYAIDVEGDTVYFTGVARSDVSTQGIPVVALDLEGNLRWSRMIVPQGATGSAHRGHSVRADGNGNLYVTGIDYSSGASGPFVAKLSGVDAGGDNLTLAWARTLTGENVGSNFDSMALDAAGNVFLALDRRGAQTFFTVLRVAPDGSATGTTMPGSNGDRTNIHVVRVAGSSVFAGGRVGLAGWDTDRGDGLFVELATADLGYQRGGQYYTGTGPNEICTHVVNGLAVSGSDLLLTGQVYTGNNNFYRYSGYWYDYPLEPEAYVPVWNDVSSTTSLFTPALADLVDTADPGFDNDGSFHDIPAALGIEHQDAVDKNESTHGLANDGEVFIMKLSAN